jgi:NADH-quinone oxidoreductase subunit N
VNLKSFTVFSEYFLGISFIYVLILSTLVTYSVYRLMTQKTSSESIALVFLLSCSLIINDNLIALDFATYNHSIINDNLAYYAKLTLGFFSAVYFLIIADSLKEQRLTSVEYLVIILAGVIGLMLMCSSNDLLTTYLATELSSLSFYILASFKKNSTYSVEGGIKYFITGAVSSAFFLLGSSFLYGISGSINFQGFVDLFESYLFYTYPYYLFDVDEDGYYDTLITLLYMWFAVNFVLPPLFESSFVESAITLILFSLFIKLALAPFHLWSLDVYEGSPTSSTVFFAVVTKLSIFVVLVRICYTTFFSVKECWQFYSLWVGLLSIFVGSFGGLKQRKLKTLIAYSSTSHMGYSLLAFSTSTYMGIQTLVFYIVIYMISGLSIWFIFLLLKLKKKNSFLKYSKELGDLVLLKKSNSTMAFAIALTMFSVAGTPPMVGFLAKTGIFLSTIGITFYFASLISILFSVSSTFYYIRLVKVMYFENLSIGKLYNPINKGKTVVLSMLVLVLILLFLNPNLLYLSSSKIIVSFL